MDSSFLTVFDPMEISSAQSSTASKSQKLTVKREKSLSSPTMFDKPKFTGCASTGARKKSCKRGVKYLTLSMLNPFAVQIPSTFNSKTQFTFQDYLCDNLSYFEQRLTDCVLCKDNESRDLLNILNADALRRICTVLRVPYTLRTTISVLRNSIIECDITLDRCLYVFTERTTEMTIVQYDDIEVLDQNVENVAVDVDPPRPCEKQLCERIINDFVADVQPEKLDEEGCAVCGQLTILSALSEFSKVSENSLNLLIPAEGLEHPTVKERNAVNEDVIHLPGPVVDYTCSKICNDCNKNLMKGRTPPFALARGFWLGEVPGVLKNLNFIEQLLVAKVRPNNYLVRVKSGRYKMRANAIAYEAPIAKVQEILPPHRKELDEVIAFIFSGPCKPTEDELHRIPLLVRRRVVQDALDWLKLNHCDYRDMKISQENLDSYSDSEIPISVEYVSLNTDGNLNPESTSLHEDEAESGVTTGPCPFILHGLTGEDLKSITDSKSIKALCLQMLTKGQKVLSIGRAQKPENTFFNPQLYPKMFPWLFPYGYGGMDNDRGIPRTKDISSLHWKRRLLMYHDKRFQTDRGFSLVAFNHEQVRDAVTASSFVTNRHNFKDITSRILNIDPDILSALAIRLNGHERVVPETLQEKLCYDLIHDLDLVGQHVQGSITNKRYMRNEIWSVICHKGAPSWFITFAPPDSKNPVCLYFADKDTKFRPIERTEDERYRLIAENPVASARYFNFMVNLFLKHVLGVNTDHSGLFGDTVAYYGTVEQQGRLTLHLHLLLWVADMLSPEKIRSRMSDESSPFKTKMIEYLESCMKGEFLSGSMETVKHLIDHKEQFIDSQDPLEQLPTEVPKACHNSCGSCLDCKQNSRWWENFPLINDHIILKANLHKCSAASCKKGKNKECKARFPREIVGESTVLPSGSINIRKHERWINNYAPVLSYVLRCNTDVTSLLSGTAIKAVVMYITDYITKYNLSTSVVFDVILSVFQKNREYLQGDDDQKDKAKKLITQLVNALTSKQEIGSPMASMYILGHPDHYTNCTFVPLNWKSYVSYVDASFSQTDNDCSCDNLDDAQYEFSKQKLLIMRHQNRLVGYNNVLDYVLRPDECNECTLYDWITQYRKIKSSQNEPKTCSAYNNNSDDNRDSNTDTDEDFEPEYQENNDPTEQHLFSVLDFRQTKLKYQPDHPQSKSHYVQYLPQGKRPLANFLNTIPRSDSNDENYCKIMLTLFKPWRDGLDLKQENLSWSECFSAMIFSESAVTLMKNFNIKYECLDSRDDYSAKSKLHEISKVWAPLTEQVMKDFDSENITDDIIKSDDGDNCFDIDQNDIQFKTRETINEEMRMHQMKHLLEELNWFSGVANVNRYIEQSHIEHDIRVKSHIYWIDLLDRLKKECNMSKYSNRTVPVNVPRMADSCIDTNINDVKIIDISELGNEPTRLNNTVQSISLQLSRMYQLNDEQYRAYQLISTHVMSKDPSQLRMLIHGMAGTGKSQVIKCIISLFEELGEKNTLAVLAPTGSAASLIGGSTYHSFLGINIHSVKAAKNNSSMNIECLQRIKSIRYIILDEVSMISLQHLYTISTQLQLGKDQKTMPFGGVNMIFAGDFGQLEPVKGASLFSTSYGTHTEFGSNSLEQECTLGKALWHQVNTVVILNQNMRQTLQTKEDAQLRKVLKNIRMGRCTDEDLDFLNSIMAINTNIPKQFSRAEFKYRSIITSRNVKRDMINSWSAAEFSKESKKELHEFYSLDNANSESIDKIRRKRYKALTDDEQQVLWNLPAGKSSSIPGKLTICPGMPVIIKRNEATELCITNGAEALVYDWHFETVRNKKRLITLFVKLLNPPRQMNLPGLPLNVVPVPRRTESITCYLPNGQTRTINRSQVCVNLNFVMTDYCSQGRTRTLNPVHLNDCKNHQAIYTCLSRSSSAAGTVILDKIPSSKLRTGLSQGMKNEFRALELLNEITKRRINKTLHPKVRSQTRQSLFDEYVKYEGSFLPTNVHKEISWKSMNCFSSYPSLITSPITVQKRPDSNIDQSLKKKKRFQSDSNRSATLNIPPSSLLMEKPTGLSWDPVNYSCAYDSLLPVLFHAWKRCLPLHRDIFLLMRFKMSRYFEQMYNSRSDFRSVRDIIRANLISTEAAPQSVSIFPTGPRPAAAHLINEFILTHEQPFLVNNTLCVTCNTLYTGRLFSSMILCDTSTWEYRMYEQSLQEGSSLSVNDWITFFYRCINVLCTNCKQRIRMVQADYKLAFFPDILASQIFTTHMFIDNTLTFYDASDVIVYELCGIIYHAQNHYTALICDSSKQLWFSDGMYKNGEFQYKGTYQTNITLSTIIGVNEHPVYACIALYIKS